MESKIMIGIIITAVVIAVVGSILFLVLSGNENGGSGEDLKAGETSFEITEVEWTEDSCSVTIKNIGTEAADKMDIEIYVSTTDDIYDSQNFLAEFSKTVEYYQGGLEETYTLTFKRLEGNYHYVCSVNLHWEEGFGGFGGIYKKFAEPLEITISDGPGGTTSGELIISIQNTGTEVIDLTQYMVRIENNSFMYSLYYDSGLEDESELKPGDVAHYRTLDDFNPGDIITVELWIHNFPIIETEVTLS